MALSRRRRALALISVLAGASCSLLFPPVETEVTLGPLGGEFTFGPVTVIVPANAVTSQHTVEITEATGTPSSPRLVGLQVNVALTPPDTLLVPATVEFRYTDFTVPARVPRATLLLHRLENGSWLPAGGTNDVATSVVSAEVTRFGDFGLLGRRAEMVQAQSAVTQPAQPNTPIATPPSVIVRDSAGLGLPGITVAFGVSAGGGSISPASAVTDASGIATAGSWTGGPSANGNAATATVLELAPVTFTTTAAAGAPTETSVSANGGSGQTATVGTAVATPPSIAVRDQFNNPFPGASVTFVVGSGRGSVTGAVQTTGTNGVATVGSWTLGPAAGTNTLSATVSGHGITGNPVTFTATGLAAAAASVGVSAGNGQAGAPLAPVATPPSVVVRDQFGNPVSGIPVTFAVGIGGGTVTGASQTTGSNGVATVGSWTLGAQTGMQTLNATATGSGISGNPVTISATAQTSPPGSVVLKDGYGQVGTVGTAVPTPPSVVVRDGVGTPLPGIVVTFGVGMGGGIVTGASQTTDSSGTATVGGWTLGGTVGTQTLIATVSGSAITGNPLTILATARAGAAAQMAENGGLGQVANANTAVAVPPSVVVMDQFYNPVQGVAVTFAVTSGGGSVTGANATTGSDGIARVGSWTLGPSGGTNTLEATSAGLTGSPVVFTATAIGVASQIAVNDGNAQSAMAGTTVATPPSVFVTDPAGNGVQGATVTFAVASGGGSIQGPVQTTGSTGIARVASWTLGPSQGVNTLTATSTGLTGSPVTFTATGTAPPVATSMAMAGGNGQSALAGTAVATAPSVIVRDQFNNPFPGAPVTFAVTGGGGSITGANQLTGSTGVARVGSWTLGSTPGTNTLTATSAGLLGSPVAFAGTATTTPVTDVYFNASEPGCDGSDVNTLFCDDFESGFWYTVDADHIFTTGGGLAAQKGWYGNIYANPITPAGAAECGNKGFRSNCAATSGYLDGHAGGRNMAERGFVGSAQLTEAWFRLYVRPQSDYNGGHEKMFDFTRGAATGQMVALCYNYFGSESIRCIPYLHQDDGLPGPPPGGAWMGSNMAASVTLIPTHWYFLEMHVRLNTPGVYDGVFEMWMNDCGTDGLACAGSPTLRGRYTNVKYLNTGAEATITIGGNWIENWANPGSVGTLFYDNVRASRAGPIGFVP